MTVSEVNALAAHVERQGVKVTRAKDGYLFRLPNQDTTMVHFTSSDVNQKHQVRRALKRAGVEWPEDHKHPDRKPTKRSAKLVRDALIALGDPETVSVKEIKDSGLTAGGMTITAVLLSMGYAASGNTSSRRFHRPPDLELMEPVDPNPQTAPAEPSGVVPGAPEREFVDLVGSWMIPAGDLPDTLSIRDARELLARVGLGMELRVWRLDNAKETAPDQSRTPPLAVPAGS